VSLVVSLTTTPMMCARILRVEHRGQPGWLARGLERGFSAMLNFYERTLRSILAHPLATMFVLAVVLVLNWFLYTYAVSYGLFPQQDTGRMIGSIQADQSISFQAMRPKLAAFVAIVQKDPAVEHVVGFTGGFQTNGGFLFMSLKPLSVRKISVDMVIARLRPQLAQVPGAQIFLQGVQDLRIGGRQSNSLYQYTLQADSLSDLSTWTPRILEALQKVPELTDVNSDQQEKGLETDLAIDRTTASRLGLNASQIDNTLYDAFGQRQVSTIYNPLNQYHVVMEVAPQFWQSPEILKDIYVSTSGGAVGGVQGTNAVAGTVVLSSSATTSATSSSGSGGTGASATSTPGALSTAAPGSSSGTSASGTAPSGGASTSSSTSTAASTAAAVATDAARNLATNNITAIGHGSASTGSAVSPQAETMIPLAAFSSYKPSTTPLGINHQGPFVANTISFNLPPGVSLGDALNAIDRTMNELHVPTSIHGSAQGTAQTYQQTKANELYLVAAALIAVYIVLGVLYESYVHPLTILSTLPSAGVGAVLALWICGIEFSIIALIGVILLIGIVKKNAIMMIDFALDAERNQGLSSRDAIYQACILRFRPIMMTTMAALLGAMPLALGLGDGGELRQPLGVSIVGGLLVSQILTLYTTPVVYLYLDRFRLWAWGHRSHGAGETAAGGPLRLG
jgi:multidrug efflux pump